MYSKDQIINLYLNESPYGGRRNGVESGAQAYFGKSAKDLTLAESALLAAIPNQPGLYDPYTVSYTHLDVYKRQVYAVYRYERTSTKVFLPFLTKLISVISVSSCIF